MITKCRDRRRWRPKTTIALFVATAVFANGGQALAPGFASAFITDEDCGPHWLQCSGDSAAGDQDIWEEWLAEGELDGVRPNEDLWGDWQTEDDQAGLGNLLSPAWNAQLFREGVEFFLGEANGDCESLRLRARALDPVPSTRTLFEELLAAWNICLDNAAGAPAPQGLTSQAPVSQSSRSSDGAPSDAQSHRAHRKAGKRRGGKGGARHRH